MSEHLTSREMALLETAFAREVESAFQKGDPGLLQTKSKLAGSLVERGYLEAVELDMGGHPPMTVRGFTLTHPGRMAYCEWASGQPDVLEATLNDCSEDERKERE